MMRLIVLTDIHANLPALEAALAVINQEGYDLLVHTGDVIGIGPFPAECLDRLLHLPRVLCILSNHDAWFARGLPYPRPDWMSEGEEAHHQWTHAQLDSSLRASVAGWPLVEHHTLDATFCTFVHYPLTPGYTWIPIMPQPTTANLDTAFASYTNSLIFYGHHHLFSDIQGRSRYIRESV